MIFGMSSGFLVNDNWPKVAGKEEGFLATRNHGSNSPIESNDRKPIENMDLQQNFKLL
jgi:hypothetical protein